MRRPRPTAALPLLLCGMAAAHAAEPAGEAARGATDDARLLDRIVVSATRTDAGAFEVPASIDAVNVQDALRRGASPAEVLQGIPGVVARDRGNYAQDTQIAIRGFGARSTFGIRGVRLYVDGIPATQPDGQGQVSHFNLDAAGRVEVLRGPFSALYGNASGGVIQLFTADAPQPPQWRFGAVAGDFATTRVYAGLRGASADGFEANLDYSRFRTDGWRAHARAERHSVNARVALPLRNGGTLALVGNALHQPYTHDPLGLTWQQFRDDPAQTTPQALEFDTRKRVQQATAGATLDLPVGDADSVRAMAYAGTRAITQFLAIPAGAQAARTNAGGVIDLQTGFGGADLRWTRTLELAGFPLQFSAGVSADSLKQRRRGFENFQAGRLGVTGRLRRDEAIRVDGLDQYAQLDWRLSQRWSVLAGVRHAAVRMQVRDRYIVPGNPDDSGQVRFSDTLPVLGAMFRASDALHLYASHGRGFETPTITEVAYRADGGSGLALDLQSATSRNSELGAKWRRGSLQAQLAAFDIRSRDELAVASAIGGRTTYRNAGRTRRQGAELSADWAFAPDWSLALAASRLNARFDDAFLGCSARCTAPDTPIGAGARMPGIPDRQAFLAVRWRPARGWNAALDLQHAGSVAVNDANSEHAPAYTLLGAETGYRWQRGRHALRAFVRVDNIADRVHAGSVIVNDGNGRYYEPGAGRAWVLGVELTASQ
jgi:iron complex outermembrane receptor protein